MYVKIDFLGKTIRKQEITPLPDKIDKFLTNFEILTSLKSLQRYTRFVNFYRQYISRWAEKLIPLYQLLQKNVKLSSFSWLKCTKTPFLTSTTKKA